MSTSDFLSRANKRIVKKAKIQEINIEEPFVKYAKKQGCYAFKLIYLNKKGFPDRTILCPKSKIFFIEFKKKAKNLSAIQNKVKAILIELGFEYYVCDEIGQAENILDKFLTLQLLKTK